MAAATLFCKTALPKCRPLAFPQALFAATGLDAAAHELYLAATHECPRVLTCTKPKAAGRQGEGTPSLRTELFAFNH